MEAKLGISGSIGLSHNKFLAKIASDLDKPRGFSVIGKEETEAFLLPKSVSIIWGVGAATRASLEKAGIRTIADLRRWERLDLTARFGSMGDRLWHLSRGLDTRRVSRDEPVKSISKETTFNEDIGDRELLKGHLWRLAEQVSDRAKARDLAGRTVTLKLKSSDFASITRRHSLSSPTQTADRIYREAEALMEGYKDPGPFRLIGVGIADLCSDREADSTGDLLDPDAGKRAAAEVATDKIRAKFGKDAIIKGRALR